MRRSRVHPSLAWLVALGMMTAGEGCKRQESAPPATASLADAGIPDAGSPDAGVRTARALPLRYSNVKLTHDGKSVHATYTLENPGGTRVRGYSCLWLHDDKGAFIDEISLGAVSLKGGDSDVFEDKRSSDARLWKQVRFVQLFTSNASCLGSPSEAVSNVLRLDPAGNAAPANTPALQSTRGLTEQDDSLFSLSDVRLHQDPESGTVSIHYTVKNSGTARFSGSVCVRGYSPGNDCGCGLEEVAAGDFSLPAGGSETLEEDVSLDTEKNWDVITSLQVSATRYGCADRNPKPSGDNVVRLSLPKEIHSYEEGGNANGDEGDDGRPPKPTQGEEPEDPEPSTPR